MAAGTSTIRYTVTNSCGTFSSNKVITVNPAAIAGTVSGAAAVCVGSTATFTSNGTSGGSWTSLSPSVATVNASTGVVRGVAAGTATIRYTITNSCGTANSSNSITVNAIPNPGTISGASSVCAGTSTTYTSNGTAGGSWLSLSTSVATVNASTGVVTGVAAGNSTIRYTVTNTCGSFSSNKVITVNPAAIAGTVSGAATVCVGSTTTFTSNGTPGGSWSSLTPSVATVSASTGVVTGVAAGTATIRYTITNSCGTANSSKSVTVSSPPTITATNISISTTLNNCSASVTFGPNVTVTGIPTPGVVYQIGTTVITSPRVFPSGTTTVTVVATNSCSSITRTFLVSVNDNQSPSITCKPNAARTTTTTQYTVSGTEFNATATDNCGTPSLMYSLSGATVVAFNAANTSLAGKLLNVGATTITWRATDANDNQTNCSSVVTVSRTTLRNILTQPLVSNLPADNQVTEPKVAPFTVKVMPNPTTNYFTLQFNSVSYEKLKITVIDVTGRVVEQNPDVPANSTLQIGNKYHPGVYIAEILQGKNKIVLRLIKVGN